jgi:hypothetical protein
MGKFFGAVGKAVWTALLVANLKLSPALPWAAGAMAGISLALWAWLSSFDKLRMRREMSRLDDFEAADWPVTIGDEKHLW